MKSFVVFVSIDHQYNNFLRHHKSFGRRRGFGPVDSFCVRIEKPDRRSIKTLLLATAQIRKLLRLRRPTAIISSHPLIGLSIAILKTGRLIKGNPTWIHWFTGQVWCNMSGIRRFIFKAIDKYIAFTSDQILCDSDGQLRFLEENGFDRKGAMKSIWPGSIAGVDDLLFEMQPAKLVSFKQPLRIGFVGRIARDKGVFDLLECVSSGGFGDHELHLFGNLDLAKDEEYFFELLERNKRYVTYHGKEIAKSVIYSSIDLLILPSYREGFGTVIAEAQAAGRPVIVRDIYGVRDSLRDGHTGYLFSSTLQMVRAVDQLASDPDLFNGMAQQAREFARRFRREDVLRQIWLEYMGTIGDL
jgi:glycosyltransferase involved in cell wall biosynthesis